MSEDNGVEIVFRKKSSFKMPRSSSSSGAGSKKAIKFVASLLLILIVGIGFYKAYPMATGFVLSSRSVDFDFTVTAKAMETFEDTDLIDLSFTKKNGKKTVVLGSDTKLDYYLYDGDELDKVTSARAKEGDSVGIEFEYFSDGGGSAKLSLNGNTLFKDLRSDLEGVQLQYEDITSISEEVTATQEGSFSVRKNGEAYQVVEVMAMPKKENNGELGEVVYEVSTSVPVVEAWIEDGFMYAKYIEAVEVPEEVLQDA